MVAEGARERRSKLRMAEQRAAISAKGVAARRGGTTESVNVSDSVTPQPKRDTRAEIAREANVSERKLRAAAEREEARRQPGRRASERKCRTCSPVPRSTMEDYQHSCSPVHTKVVVA